MPVPTVCTAPLTGAVHTVRKRTHLPCSFRPTTHVAALTASGCGRMRAQEQQRWADDDELAGGAVAAPDAGIRMPAPDRTAPLLAIARRLALALAVVLVNWLLVIAERGSYTDNVDGNVSVTDALYYTTVTLSTTGYGDITPVTTQARLLNALLVTPMRLLFVIVLVGTTIQALTQRSREEFRLSRWRSRVRDHVVVVGYGAKGRNAIRELVNKGHPQDRVVVVDVDRRAVAEASQAGFVTVEGSATRTDVLTEALVDRAATVIVALDRDDT